MRRKLEALTAAGALVAAVSLGACSTTADPAATVGGTSPQPATAAAPAGDPFEERVAAIVKSRILDEGVPSVSVAVLRDGKMLLERAWGVADTEKNVRASPTTVYPTGSVTKQFTAALLLKQVERGRLALSDPIGQHLSGLPPEAAAVTVEQLLNHTSGLQRPAAVPAQRLEEVSRETLLTMVVGDKLATTPGTKFEYSNAGYTVLGILIEKLYGTSYAAALHDEIAAPLGLTTLTKCGEPKPEHAAGYFRNANGTIAPPPGLHHSQALGADGVCATAADLVRWTHALHGGRVLSDASYRAMTTPRGAAVASDYGFGLAVRPAEWGDQAIIHGGQALTGHAAELQWYPEHKLAVALLYNVVPRLPDVADAIPRIVLGVPLAERKPAPAEAAPQAAPPSAPATPAERANFAGVYALPSHVTAEVTLENGQLYATPPGGGKQPLIFRSGNTYALGSAESTTTITFLIENGTVTGFEANANGSKRILKKIQ
ncbi:MAG TPA: serine hydrolase [Thermoanaerobaculia bacterium]|nr:serine hydrolase [Thermoanaerobaculia bacterium]